jgi:uncharacterized protein (DUF1697 family)
MPTFISMLRGINVSGHRLVPMKELRQAYEALGLANVQTYVQSGNVVFDAAPQSSSKVAALLEAHLQRCLGFAVPVLVRSRSEFAKVVETNPFAKQPTKDPTKFHVTFLASRPSAAALGSLDTTRDQADEYILADRQIYLCCPGGYGETKFSNGFFEKKLKVSATTRNWKTVLALHALAGQR